MIKFLNGPNGEQSSKRLFCCALMVFYIMMLTVNLFTGRKLDPTLQEQLFYMILAFVFAITLEGFKEVFKTKVDQLPKTLP